MLALRALGVGPGDDVVVPSFTFYASAEAIPPTGARPGLLRRRPRHVLRDGRDRARRAHAAHEGRDRRAPVRQRRADRGDRGARRPGGRGRRAGRRLDVAATAAPARSARSRRSRSSRRRTSARSATAARSPRNDAELAERVRLLRFHGSHDKGTLRARRPQLAARRAAGRDPARAAAAPRRLVRRPPRRRARTTRSAGLGELVDAAAARRGARPGLAPVRVRHERADALAAALAARGHRPQGLLPRARAPPAGDGRVGRGRRAAGHRRGRAHAPRDPDEPGAHRRAGRRGRRRGAFGWPPAPNRLPPDAPQDRLAALPVHRHSLPQIAVDAGLVALAYFLAFRLRFDRGVPTRYEDLFAAHDRVRRRRQRRRSSRSSGSTGTGCATRPSASTCGSSRRWSWRRSRSSATWRSSSRGRSSIGYAVRRVSTSRPACSCSTAAHARVPRRRALRGPHRLERPLRRLPRAARRALGADRRRGRRRAAAPARDPAQPGARLPAGRLRRRRPAQAGRARSTAALDVLGTTERARQRARGRRARRGADRDPVGAGHAARARRARVPRARRRRAHDADGVRAAADRRRR